MKKLIQALIVLACASCEVQQYVRVKTYENVVIEIYPNDPNFEIAGPASPGDTVSIFIGMDMAKAIRL